MRRREIEPAELIDFDLDDVARRILSQGLKEWGGPARCTEEMALAMGFSSVANLFAEGERISGAIRSHHPLARHDWARALLATEIVFASSYMGAGLEWSIVTGVSDTETVDALRRMQRTLSRSQLPRIGTEPTATPLALRRAEGTGRQLDDP